MSKFSKALEKIQKDREGKTAVIEGRIPNFEIPENAQENVGSWERGIAMAKNARPDTRIVTYHYPTSVLTEQYRMLSHNLKTQIDKEGAKVIMISSSVHSEGKTVTATNLALALTEIGNSKVALVDADLRRGRVAEYLGLKKEAPGLSQYLSNGLSAKQAMIRNSIDNLVIIPAGEPINNPTGLLGSAKFKALIAELRLHFDYVIIDSPPIMAVADAGIVGRDADGLLMVIQSGRTPKSVIIHANILFKQAGIRMLGYVLTNVEFQSADYRYYYYSYDQDSDEEMNQTFFDKVGNFKQKTLQGIKSIGPVLEKKEQQLNRWWESHILKKTKDQRPKTEDQEPEEE